MAGDRVAMPHVDALDGLRGAAIVAVLLYHGDHLKGGYLGVDLFFVLSGYLITSMLLAEWCGPGHGRIALGAFWARRARRLLPALVLVLAGVAVYCVVFAEPTELGRIRGDAFATIAYVANWRAIVAGHGYFDLFRAPSPLQHTWSLAIEEQFYLIWPLMFIGLAAGWKRRTPQAVLATAVVLAGISWALMLGLYDLGDPSRVYYGTDTRAFALFAGIALAASIAIWGHTRDRILRVALEVAAAVATATLAVMWTRLDGQSPSLYRGGFALAGIAAALLVAAAAHPRRGPIGWLLSFRPLRWLGLISYGLYLWHWPVDVVLDGTRTNLVGWNLFALRTAVAIALALASYLLVEMPIRRGALRSTQWRTAVPVIAAGLLTIIVATTAGAVSTPTATSGMRYTSTHSAEVLLIGDSMANSLAPGIRDSDGKRSALWWLAGCRWIHGQVRFPNQFNGDCDWEAALPAVLRASRPKRVVILMGTSDLIDVKPSGLHRFVGPGDARWDRVFAGQLARGVALIAAHHALVTFLTIPCVDPVTHLVTSAAEASVFEIGRVRALNNVIKSVAVSHPGQASVADLFGLLCPKGHFATKVRGVVTRTDGEHLSPAGADMVGRWLNPQLGLSSP